MFAAVRWCEHSVQALTSSLSFFPSLFFPFFPFCFLGKSAGGFDNLDSVFFVHAEVDGGRKTSM